MVRIPKPGPIEFLVGLRFPDRDELVPGPSKECGAKLSDVAVARRLREIADYESELIAKPHGELLARWRQ